MKSLKNTSTFMGSLFQEPQKENQKDGIAIVGLEEHITSFRYLFNSIYRKQQIINFNEEYHYNECFSLACLNRKKKIRTAYAKTPEHLFFLIPNAIGIVILCQPSNSSSVEFMRSCLLELSSYQEFDKSTPILILCEENSLKDVNYVNKLKKKVEAKHNVTFGRMDFKTLNKEKTMTSNISRWLINFK
eukprot:gene6752-10917_t